VVVATYNRRELCARLLGQLAQQTLAPGQFEVVVVDDGSREPVKPFLESLKVPYALTVVEQANQGAAAARHNGALAAHGEILLITDDDMQVPPGLLEAHLERHQAPKPRVVLGRILPDPGLTSMPLFERWYAYRLEKMAQGMQSGRITPRGGHLFTGNVSLPRAAYVAVGGFDPTLKRSEDLELGLRLERAGLEVVFAPEAHTLHGSDHTRLETWLNRAFLYGVFDSRIRDKHPDLPNADPWRFFFRLSPVARPFLLLAAIAPSASQPVSRLAWGTVTALDKLGLEPLAFAGASVVYQMEYYRGVRREAGSLRATLSGLGRHFKTRRAR
jgi:GT2 family glycosyltransferase